MIINFLGTGTSQGVPVIGSKHPVCFSNDPKDKRLRSSIIIDNKNYIILIDCGPDFRYQMLRSGYNNVDAIIFTHEHSDHILGLDDIRPISFNNNNKILPIYGLSRVLDEIKHRFYYFFLDKNKYIGSPNLKFCKVYVNEIIYIKSIKIIPIKVFHGSLFILGYIIDDCFAYITDASFLPKESMELLIGIKILVINALRIYPKHPSHFILPEVLKIIDKLKPRKTYITHISNFLGFHSIVTKNLPKNVYLAYDGLKIII